LEMVPSREEEVKLKEYREDAVSTFVVDDYVRLQFKGSTGTSCSSNITTLSTNVVVHCEAKWVISKD
jgi:hypothetical protein